MFARVRLAAWEEHIARDGREARRRRRLPRLREDLAQQRQHVDEGVVMRVRERLEQVKSPLRDAVVVGPREGWQERRVAYRDGERRQKRREQGPGVSGFSALRRESAIAVEFTAE